MALVLLGLVMVFEAPLKIISHDYTAPSYVHHHHHLCHVLTMGVAVLTWWWFALLLLLFRNGEAMQHKWAQRSFGVPVIVLAVVGGVAGFYAYQTIDSHDEVTYASVMGVLDGALLVVIAFSASSIANNALIEERLYAWRYLLLSAAFNAALFALFYFNSVLPGAVLSGIAFCFYVIGLYKAHTLLQQQKVV